MTDIRVSKLADLMVNYSVAVKPGERVAINGNTTAEPLLKEIYIAVLKAGGYPLMMLGLPGMDEIFYSYASDDQLRYMHEPLKSIIETYDVRISVLSEVNTRSLSSVDSAKTVLYSQSHAEMSRIMLRRAAEGTLRWTLTLFPTNAFAQDAEMGLREYEDFVYTACMPDLDDPISYWRRFSAWQERIAQWMTGKKMVHVTGPDTDLRVNIEGRSFINCDGHENMPDGEVFTGPVEDGVEGHVRFSYPAIYQGREVTGVQLWFEKGRVVKATAEKNEEFLLKTLDTDEGSRRVGEFAIGTNEGIQRFHREILFDEKINGSFHMAVGAGYPESGSRNESAIHWDMICDLRKGGQITVDGKLIYENGRFVIDF
jgi:aminopeptidase